MDLTGYSLMGAVGIITAMQKPKTKAEQFEMVIDVICEETGLPKDMVYVKSRKQEIVRARHLIWYVSRKKYGLGVMWLQERFNIDHSTICTGTKTLISRIKNEPEIKELYLRIMSKLRYY